MLTGATDITGGHHDPEPHRDHSDRRRSPCRSGEHGGPDGQARDRYRTHAGADPVRRTRSHGRRCVCPNPDHPGRREGAPGTSRRADHRGRVQGRGRRSATRRGAAQGGRRMPPVRGRLQRQHVRPRCRPRRPGNRDLGAAEAPQELHRSGIPDPPPTDPRSLHRLPIPAASATSHSTTPAKAPAASPAKSSTATKTYPPVTPKNTATISANAAKPATASRQRHPHPPPSETPAVAPPRMRPLAAGVSFLAAGLLFGAGAAVGDLAVRRLLRCLNRD